MCLRNHWIPVFAGMTEVECGSWPLNRGCDGSWKTLNSRFRGNAEAVDRGLLFADRPSGQAQREPESSSYSQSQSRIVGMFECGSRRLDGDCDVSWKPWIPLSRE